MIYESGGSEDVSGPVQNYCPLRVFSFLNPSPSAAAILYGRNEGVGGGGETGAPIMAP